VTTLDYAPLDYAQLFENEYRPSRRLRRAVARLIWAGLFIVRPSVALDILHGR